MLFLKKSSRSGVFARRSAFPVYLPSSAVSVLKLQNTKFIKKLPVDLKA